MVVLGPSASVVVLGLCGCCVVVLGLCGDGVCDGVWLVYDASAVFMIGFFLSPE